MQVEAITAGHDVQLDTEYGEGLVVPRFSDIRVRNVGTVDNVDGASADHFEDVVVEDDRRIFVDANAQDPWISRDRAQQTPDTAALCKMLIDDNVANQAQSRRHVKVADPV
jgi:hypothetical protein